MKCCGISTFQHVLAPTHLNFENPWHFTCCGTETYVTLCLPTHFTCVGAMTCEMRRVFLLETYAGNKTCWNPSVAHEKLSGAKMCWWNPENLKKIILTIPMVLMRTAFLFYQNELILNFWYPVYIQYMYIANHIRELRPMHRLVPLFNKTYAKCSTHRDSKMRSSWIRWSKADVCHIVRDWRKL